MPSLDSSIASAWRRLQAAPLAECTASELTLCVEAALAFHALAWYAGGDASCCLTPRAAEALLCRCRTEVLARVARGSAPRPLIAAALRTLTVSLAPCTPQSDRIEARLRTALSHAALAEAQHSATTRREHALGQQLRAAQALIEQAVAQAQDAVMA